MAVLVLLNHVLLTSRAHLGVWISNLLFQFRIWLADPFMLVSETNTAKFLKHRENPSRSQESDVQVYQLPQDRCLWQGQFGKKTWTTNFILEPQGLEYRVLGGRGYLAGTRGMCE